MMIGLGDDLASQCAAGDAAACTAYYATVYPSAPSVTATKTGSSVINNAATTPTPAQAPSLTQIAAALGGSVTTVPNLGPFGGSVTYVSVGGQLLDANLLQQRFATDGTALALSETQQELQSIQQAAAQLPPQNTSNGTVTPPTWAGTAPGTTSTTTTTAPPTSTTTTAPASTGIWSDVQNVLAPATSATGLSATTLLLILGGAGLLWYMSTRK
jgi:hypothetical protein